MFAAAAAKTYGRSSESSVDEKTERRRGKLHAYPLGKMPVTSTIWIIGAELLKVVFP